MSTPEISGINTISAVCVVELRSVQNTSQTVYACTCFQVRSNPLQNQLREREQVQHNGFCISCDITGEWQMYSAENTAPADVDRPLQV